MAKIVSKLPELLLEKGKREKRLKPNGKVNLKHIQRELEDMGLGMTYRRIHEWSTGSIGMYDGNVLARWCVYLDCTPGDILTLVADDD